MVRRVGLGAEAVEARTLFDCHIWPECRGKLALGSRDRREKKVGGASLLASGTVKWFDEENGYGFISADEDGRDLFVHRGSIVGDWRTRTLSEGTRVGFEPREGGIGPEAIHVLPLSLKGSP